MTHELCDTCGRPLVFNEWLSPEKACGVYCCQAGHVELVELRPDASRLRVNRAVAIEANAELIRRIIGPSTVKGAP